MKDRLARYDAARPKDDPLAAYREAEFGGDAENGRRLFFYKNETTCLRCHKINGEGGEVGPELKGIGAKQNRDYILESIVDPNKQIAKGYESVLLVLNDGQTRTGVLKGEDAKEIRLMTAEGKLVVGGQERRGRAPSGQIGDAAGHHQEAVEVGAARFGRVPGGVEGEVAGRRAALGGCNAPVGRGRRLAGTLRATAGSRGQPSIARPIRCNDWFGADAIPGGALTQQFGAAAMGLVVLQIPDAAHVETAGRHGQVG